jgi:anti-sigma B factor antagonist
MDDAVTLDIGSSLDDGRAVVVLRGELDLATRAPLADELQSLVAAGATSVVVDLAGVTFLDSTGLGTLLEARRLGADLSLRNPQGRVRRLLDLVMIDGVVPIEYG